MQVLEDRLEELGLEPLARLLRKALIDTSTVSIRTMESVSHLERRLRIVEERLMSLEVTRVHR